MDPTNLLPIILFEIILDCLAISFVTDLDNSLLNGNAVKNYEEKEKWYVVPKNKHYTRKVICCFMWYDMLQALSQLVLTLIILPCASFKLSDERMRNLWFGTPIAGPAGVNITNSTQNI